MKLVAVDIANISKIKYSKSKVLNILESFRDSDAEAVRVHWDDSEYADAKSCATTLGHAAKIYHMNNIRSVIRKGNVYLIKL